MGGRRRVRARSDERPLCAAKSGTIVFAGWDPSGFGFLVKIRHDDRYTGYYAHVSRIDQSSGTVDPNKPFGPSGNSGQSTVPHLHFEVRNAGNYLGWVTLPGGTWNRTPYGCMPPGQQDGEATGPALSGGTTTPPIVGANCDGAEGSTSTEG